MAMMDGKAVLVTGAGRGIGREIALAMAREGAAVVVNDTGGALDGAGHDRRPACETAATIRAAGGRALADCGSVADADAAEAMVAAAQEAFGGLDAVVNNAGILRDGIFHKMERADFKAVLAVHLEGAFHVSRAAAPAFRARGAGAFVHLTSTSGLVGHIGQANYAAAKMGVAGLSRSIALDMARFGVRSNCIAPFAFSRMIASMPGARSQAEGMQRLAPARVAPLAVFLASEAAAKVTGQIFAIGGEKVYLMSQPRPIRSLRHAGGWTPQALAERMLPAFADDLCPLETALDVFSDETP